MKTTDVAVDFFNFCLPIQFLFAMTVTPNRIKLDCDHLVQQARQDHLEGLYVLDGRDSPDHALHGLYTGLAQKYAPEAA